eukprot:SAG11_NODE_24153_length_377_cov_1.000000_1_plen_43_part_10
MFQTWWNDLKIDNMTKAELVLALKEAGIAVMKGGVSNTTVRAA